MKNNLIRLALFFIIILFFCFQTFSFTQNINRSNKFYAYNLMEKGIFHFNLNQYESAIDYFTQTLKIYPSLFAAREWRAKSFYKTGQIENAREEYKRLISINPEDIRLKNQLDEIDFILSHPETFVYTPNYINSAIYPLQKSSRGSIPINISKISDNKIAIPDFESGKVGIYAIDGKHLYNIPQGNLRFEQPFDVTADNQGNIYISDYKDNYVYKYSTELKLISKFGGSGHSESSLYGPRGIVSDGRYNLYVIDRWNRKIKKFSNQGKYILSVENRVDGLYEIDEPYDITFLDEVIYVTDSAKASVFAFDNYGTFINEYKHHLFEKPRGISITKDKSKLIIVDEVNGALFMDVKTKKVVKVSDLSEVNGRFLKMVETYDGRLLGINESVSGIYAFVDELLKASGLKVDVIRSAVESTNSSTLISHLVSINDKLGRPIIDISENNIWITEENIELGNPISIEPFPPKSNNGMSLIVVNEMSNEMKEKEEDIKIFLKDVVKKLTLKDSVQLININNKINIKNHFNSDPLEIIYLFNQDEYQNIKNVSIGKGLMFGIGRALSIYDRSSAVVFLTAGDTPNESLGDVTAGDIYNYSLANDIPIYTIVFGKNSENDFLSRLASESDGKLINYYKSPEINKITNIIRENRKKYYIITYETIVGNSNEFRYKEAIIEVTSNGMTGSTKVGYFDKYGN